MSHRDDGAAPGALSRRALLERGASAAALLALPSVARSWFSDVPPTRTPFTDRPYLDAARRAEHWIARSAKRDPRGLTWPADPTDAASVQLNLYSGSPGVVLFYLELFAATGETPYLESARAGADYLMGTLPNSTPALGDEGAGLYTGVAGIAYTVAMVHRATHDAKYATGVEQALQLLATSVKPVGAGVAWNTSTDIISGSGGIILTLLWLKRHGYGAAMPSTFWNEIVTAAGLRLIELGVAERGGMKWSISDTIPKRYPNFSHGTAGVSYVLATLYGETKSEEFLAAAVTGHTYLQAIATTTPNDGLRVFHSEPGGEQLFYLSWCHGPAGTARLYKRLWDSTHDPRWRTYIPRLAQGIVDSGVPEQHPDGSGYWNNISQCCGNCGVSEFFLAMHAFTRDERHLAFARRVVDNTVSRATTDGDGLKWIQAEHRVRPGLLVAQTGLMQGAAGVGLALLHLDGALQGRGALVALPDAPDWG